MASRESLFTVVRLKLPIQYSPVDIAEAVADLAVTSPGGRVIAPVQWQERGVEYFGAAGFFFDPKRSPVEQLEGKLPDIWVQQGRFVSHSLAFNPAFFDLSEIHSPHVLRQLLRRRG